MTDKPFVPFLIVSILLFGSVSGQSSYDLIVMDARVTAKGLRIDPSTVEALTDRAEYDNQPNFINDQQVAFSAADETGNHDIIIYDFKSKKFTNLTKTKALSEFSPAITDCGLYVSAVTVEEDGKQRLWLYPTNFGEPELLYDDIAPVGYYDWYDNKAAMFVLGQPNSLVYPYSKSDVVTISQNIGRSIKRKPNTSIITYVDKSGVKETDGGPIHAIVGYDLETKQSFQYGNTLPGKEDFIWLDKNTLLMGKGNELFVRKYHQKEWTGSDRLEINGYQNISRMAYSKKLKKLVVVMERSK